MTEPTMSRSSLLEKRDSGSSWRMAWGEMTRSALNAAPPRLVSSRAVASARSLSEEPL